jgi:hypothetical protein
MHRQSKSTLIEQERFQTEASANKAKFNPDGELLLLDAIKLSFGSNEERVIGDGVRGERSRFE